MHDLLIIGGGPAGLSAAVYACRKRLDAVLISLDIGGQPNTTGSIENYLGYQLIEGPELVEKFYSQVTQFPIEQKVGVRISRLDRNKKGFEATAAESGESYQARAAVFATGKKPRKLEVPGEDKYLGKGVSYCAVCDGPVFAEQRVAVIGGGNSALEAALDMVKIAAHVDLVSVTELTGDALLVERLSKHKNLTIYLRHQPQRIAGNEFVKELVAKDLVRGEERTLQVAGVLIEIGLVPNSEPVKNLLKLNHFGEVPISCFCETTVPGLYAAGDVTDVPEKQIIIAAGEGAKAALQAHRYLQRL